jgi:hypothetical protein
MYLVSTIGRCGSSMLISTLQEYLLSVDNPKAKNHYYPVEVENHRPPVVGAIFLFGDITDVILSIRRSHERLGNEWIDLHNKNLNGDYENRYNYLKKDTFQLERMFDEWMRPQNFPLLTLKYEDMWENEDIISRFLGCPHFELPEFNQTSNKHGSGKESRFFRRAANKELVSDINKNYSSLIKKVNNFPSAKIW